jgi:8-oxo-dGTP diphosphatase
MKVIVNVVVQSDDKVLMVQEAWGDVKGMWNFPAGHLDEGENIFDGAIREAKEETGYDVELVGLVNVQNALYDNKHVIHFVFAAKIVGGEISFDPNEIMNVEFVDIDKLINMTDDELRGGDTRRESLTKIKNGEILPLSVVSNFDFKTK